jgi:MinD superfamily P-loop ATPase containing an inserted ferredoxin domain
MVVYFTGTGNSRYAAQLIADKTVDTIIDAREYIKEKREANLTSDRPWIFVAPTYAWRLPRVFENFILGGSFRDNGAAYFVMTCGTGIGNAEKEIQKLCAKKGFTCMGVLPAVMPENYLALFDVPDKAEAEKLIEAADDRLQSAIPFIIKRKPFPAVKRGFADWIKTAAVNPVFYRLVVKADPFHITDACTGCGKCARLCPLNTITLVEGKPQWRKNCTHCMACICQCPAKAIEYGARSNGKPRYQCPEYRTDSNR